MLTGVFFLSFQLFVMQDQGSLRYLGSTVSQAEGQKYSVLGISPRENADSSDFVYHDQDVAAKGWEHYKNLGRLPDKMTVDQFCRKFRPYLKSSKADERANAVQVLALVLPASDADILEATKDISPMVRKAAVAQLVDASCTGKFHVSRLLEMLADKDQEVRRVAISSLGDIGYFAEMAVPELTSILLNEKENGCIRAEAANSLCSIDGTVFPQPWIAEYLAKTQKWSSPQELLLVLRDANRIGKFIRKEDITALLNNQSPTCGQLLSWNGPHARFYLNGDENRVSATLDALIQLDAPQLIPLEWAMARLKTLRSDLGIAEARSLVNACQVGGAPRDSMSSQLLEHYRSEKSSPEKRIFYGYLLVQVNPFSAAAREFLSDANLQAITPYQALIDSSNQYVAAAAQRNIHRLLKERDLRTAISVTLNAKGCYSRERATHLFQFLDGKTLVLNSESPSDVSSAVLKLFREQLHTIPEREYCSLNIESANENFSEPQTSSLLGTLIQIGDESDARWIASLIEQSNRPRMQFLALSATRTYGVVPQVILNAVSKSANSKEIGIRLISAQRLLMSDPLSPTGLDVLRRLSQNEDPSIRHICLQFMRDVPCRAPGFEKLALDPSDSVRELASSMMKEDRLRSWQSIRFLGN